jgi:hypothetical protein
MKATDWQDDELKGCGTKQGKRRRKNKQSANNPALGT